MWRSDPGRPSRVDLGATLGEPGRLPVQLGQEHDQLVAGRLAGRVETGGVEGIDAMWPLIRTWAVSTLDSFRRTMPRP